MKIINQIKLISILIFISVGLTTTVTANDKLNKVIASKHREASSSRDKYRHPAETLNFFQVEANHKVVEIWPGGGAWYTEILAPYLADEGVLYGAMYNPETESKYQLKTMKKFNAKMSANQELYGKVKVVVFSPPSDFQLGADASVDRVLTFRNVHNWTRSGDEAVLAAFQAFYKVLKPGGKLGVTDHRLPEDRTSGTGGYLKQSYVIKMAEAAGFKLEASSEINANSKDTADYEKGVWTLPPRLALKEKDKEKYLAIGESDRMTLLFVKK